MPVRMMPVTTAKVINDLKLSQVIGFMSDTAYSIYLKKMAIQILPSNPDKEENE